MSENNHEANINEIESNFAEEEEIPSFDGEVLVTEHEAPKSSQLEEVLEAPITKVEEQVQEAAKTVIIEQVHEEPKTIVIEEAQETPKTAVVEETVEFVKNATSNDANLNENIVDEKEMFRNLNRGYNVTECQESINNSTMIGINPISTLRVVRTHPEIFKHLDNIKCEDFNKVNFDSSFFKLEYDHCTKAVDVFFYQLRAESKKVDFKFLVDNIVGALHKIKAVAIDSKTAKEEDVYTLKASERILTKAFDIKFSDGSDVIFSDQSYKDVIDDISKLTAKDSHGGVFYRFVVNSIKVFVGALLEKGAMKAINETHAILVNSPIYDDVNSPYYNDWNIPILKMNVARGEYNVFYSRYHDILAAVWEDNLDAADVKFALFDNTVAYDRLKSAEPYSFGILRLVTESFYFAHRLYDAQFRYHPKLVEKINDGLQSVIKGIAYELDCDGGFGEIDKDSCNKMLKGVVDLAIKHTGFLLWDKAERSAINSHKIVSDTNDYILKMGLNFMQAPLNSNKLADAFVGKNLLTANAIIRSILNNEAEAPYSKILMALPVLLRQYPEIDCSLFDEVYFTIAHKMLEASENVPHMAATAAYFLGELNGPKCQNAQYLYSDEVENVRMRKSMECKIYKVLNQEEHCGASGIFEAYDNMGYALNLVSEKCDAEQTLLESVL